MTNRVLWGLLPALIALTSCGHAARQAAPASTASQGVRVTLASGRCYVNRSTEQFPTVVHDDRTHVDVKLEVVNDADRMVEVDLDRVRLADRAGGEAVAPRQSGTVSLAPGESRSVALAFEAGGRHGCRRGLALAVDDAVTAAGEDLDLAPLPFQPAR